MLVPIISLELVISAEHFPPPQVRIGRNSYRELCGGVYQRRRAREGYGPQTVLKTAGRASARVHQRSLQCKAEQRNATAVRLIR